MWVSVVSWLVLALGAGCALGAAQLETGVMALLYYPPAPRAPTSSTQPPYARWRLARRRPRFGRSYFDRDEDGSQEGNDALLQRLRANMTNPNWTPDEIPVVMIRVACLLVLTASALAAPAPPPSATAAPGPGPGPAPSVPIVLQYERRPEDLLNHTLLKMKRSASPPPPPDNRKLFVVKSPCRKDKCAHLQLYEFDLFRVEPSVNGKGVYY